MSVVNFLWDPVEDNVVKEFDDSGVQVTDYTTEPQLYGNLISQNGMGKASQLHYDALGSTLAVTNKDQKVTDIRAYAAFGETTDQVGSTQLVFAYIGRSGYYHDHATRDYSVRQRFYSPNLSRWLSPDPLDPGQLSGYAFNARRRTNAALVTHSGPQAYKYVSNVATQYIDPSGLQSTKLNQAACCQYTRACSCLFPPINPLARRAWIENTEPETKACPVALDKSGMPILTPQKCCNSHVPKSRKLNCSDYVTLTAAKGMCGSVWTTDCEWQMSVWIRYVGGDTVQGMAACCEWCESCMPDTPIAGGVVKFHCVRDICQNAFPNESVPPATTINR